MQIFARMCGVIQGLDFLFRFVFPMWIVAAEMRISLKRDIQRVWFGSSGRLSIFDLTFLVKHDKSMPLRHHLGALRMTGWQQILWFISITIGRWSEPPKGSASFQDVFADQLL